MMIKSAGKFENFHFGKNNISPFFRSLFALGKYKIVSKTIISIFPGKSLRER